MCLVSVIGLYVAHLVGYQLLRVLLSPPRGDFVDHVFHKAYCLTSFLKHVFPLAAAALGCYSVLITLSLIKKQYEIKAVKLVLIK